MQMTTGCKEDRVAWWPLAAAGVVVAVPVACRGYDIGQDFPMPVAWLLGTLTVIVLGAVLPLVWFGTCCAATGCGQCRAAE